MNTDKALEKVGGFGLFQLRLFFQIGFAQILTSFILMVMTFSTAEPPWRCTVNSTACNLNGTFILGDKNYKDRCSLPRKDWEFAVEGTFDSIVTEFDLVCDTAVYVSIANSTVFILYLIGALIASVLSDKFGRKNVSYSFAIFACLAGFISAFAQTYWVFAVFRALAGVGIGAFTICSYVLLMEYTGTRYRSRVGFSIFYHWILALCLLALLGYLIPSWRTLTIVTSAPGLLIFVCWWYSPESLRWLLIKGRIEDATAILHDVARVNKRSFSDADIAVFEKIDNPKLGNIKDLFASRAIAIRTLVSCYCWFVSGLVYYGISLSTPSVGGNMYLNFFIGAVCEGIAMVIGMFLLDRIGRRKTIVINVWLAGIVLIIGGLLNFYDDKSDGFLAGKIIASLVLGKTFITIVFDGVYVFSSELFPTVIRNTAMGTSTSAARIGSAMAPYIVYSERVHAILPFTLMAIAAVIGGVVCMLLPETSNMDMPETVQQVSGKDDKNYNNQNNVGNENDDEDTILCNYRITTNV